MPKVNYHKYFDIDLVLDEIKKYLPNVNGERFLKAFYFAEQAHSGQLRKDGVTPYIVHPVEIVKILIRLHADEETLISALLHDVPEDTEHDIDEIHHLFGEKIAFLVDGITKLSTVHYQQHMPERQVESLKKMFLHSAEDLRVIIIKLADRLHNMSTLQYIEEPEKRLRIARETLEIYVPIANLLGIQELKSKLED
ncbi:bifunctional (p)ppGpp synthetase/guanosine-3',5'-bis(diphosphate) 3'-pyrophosphohydrolase, partial [Candidatus Peregrinibacteria bacterium]|nr:bifunctional (p)ppGpp synthetase/guanosine-3',5'-bis(diphosphate) 3'-pyrophosphohydrolase [Candidatus Peregrinibacteria bacterium]